MHLYNCTIVNVGRVTKIALSAPFRDEALERVHVNSGSVNTLTVCHVFNKETYKPLSGGTTFYPTYRNLEGSEGNNGRANTM